MRYTVDLLNKKYDYIVREIEADSVEEAKKIALNSENDVNLGITDTPENTVIDWTYDDEGWEVKDVYRKNRSDEDEDESD